MTDNVFHNWPEQPAHPLPPFEDDLAELAWLQCSVQLPDRVDQVPQRPAQPVQPPHHQRVAGPQCVQHLSGRMVAARIWRSG